MKKLEEKELKALLVIVTGLNIFAWFLENKYLTIAAIAIGVISLIIPTVGYYIVWLWYKIAEVLGWINSRIILAVLFYLFLFPISIIYRLFNKDSLHVKKPGSDTMFTSRDHQYSAKDFENMW
ncbi:MAG: SxtJ family membrane protein [Bacteroidota bacterium]